VPFAKVVEIYEFNHGGIMTTVQVQYDGYNQLKILHGRAKAQREDGEVYTLAFLESENGVDVEWVDIFDDAASTSKT
jgi:hypothetical protein